MLPRPSHAGLRHVALHVRDLEAMKAFYMDLLGFQMEWEPDPDNVYLTSGSDNLALHRMAGDTAPAGLESTLDHLGLVARTAEDVDSWAAFLEENGVELSSQPRTHRDGARSFYFRDPDGNRVQIIHIRRLADNSLPLDG
jgi:catechol 2,3-dioxygenase-like lactoylglutathione lyase family enzyme